MIDAILLSAGLGTRLKPVTNNIPKCLVKVGGKPVLEHWLEKLEAINCNEVIINKHYLSELVSRYLLDRKKTNLKITSIYEKELLGTAGSLMKYYRQLDAKTLIVMHADNSTNFKLERLLEAHNNRNSACEVTMVTFTTQEPQNCGIVQVDSQGIVRRFEEKSNDPTGNIANGAIFAIEGEFL